MNSGTPTWRSFRTNPPQRSILGMKLRWRVLSIALEKSISSPGIRVNTDSILNRMDLISTMPMSKPI